LIVAGSVWWLWSSSSPWDRPVWPVLGIVAAWLVLLVGVDEDALSRRARAASIATLAVVTVAFLVLAAFGSFGAMRYGPVFTHLEPTASVLLDQRPDTYGPCGPGIEGLDYGDLRVPDEVCVSNYDNPMSGSVRQVAFRWGRHTLVYEGGFRPASSQCSAHLDGPWWAEVPVDPNCPYGFTFSGMG
jgi:hypothetical protein